MIRIPATTYEKGGKTIYRKGYLKKGTRSDVPKSKRWYKPTVKMSWSKDMDIEERRENALDAHKGDVLSTARALQALANVTRSKETEKAARADAKFFFAEHKKSK